MNFINRDTRFEIMTELEKILKSDIDLISKIEMFGKCFFSVEVLNEAQLKSSRRMVYIRLIFES